jgi:uncharacterized C2H2 Zn-finger protein
MYECPRCETEFKQKHHLAAHFNRKIGCEFLNEDISNKECIELLKTGKLKKKIIVEHTCEHCNKNFDRKSRLTAHLNKCKEKLNLQEIIKQLKQKNKELIEKSSTSNINTTNNNNNTTNNNDNSTNDNSNNTNNIYININSYKNTDYTLIKDDIDDCIENGEINIGKLMEKVHFNDKFPQNRNVYISNSKTRRVMKYDGEKFIEDGMGNAGLETVFNEKLADIEEHQELTDDIKLAAEESWMKYNDKDTIQRKEVLEAIYKPLYNKRDIVNKNLIET